VAGGQPDAKKSGEVIRVATKVSEDVTLPVIQAGWSAPIRTSPPAAFLVNFASRRYRLAQEGQMEEQAERASARPNGITPFLPVRRLSALGMSFAYSVSPASGILRWKAKR
jgi:hypothetical protein